MGVLKGFQALDMLRIVQGVMDQAQEWGEHIHVVKTDLKNTYDRVTLPGLAGTLTRRGMLASLLRAHFRRVVSRHVTFSAPGMPKIESALFQKGLPQGCPASPVLFTAFREDALNDLERPRGKAFPLTERACVSSPSHMIFPCSAQPLQEPGPW